jgi:hypothetical protein
MSDFRAHRQQLFAHNFYPERTKFCRSAWYVYSMRRGVTFDLLAEGSTLGVNLQDIFTRLGFRSPDAPKSDHPAAVVRIGGGLTFLTS